MNNRIFLVLIVVLSCAIFAVGAGLIGTALYLQGQLPTAASFATPPAANGLLTPAARAGAPQPGDLAPDFSGTTIDGETVKLSDFQGKPVMINFWASWCGPCTAEMKNIEAIYQKYKSEDIVILGVNQGEGTNTIKGYGELWKLTFRLLRDEGDAAARSYRVQALPTTVFVDADGRVYQVHIGGPMSIEFIQARVNELLAKIK
jgi:peroxiredoxin